MKPATSTAWLSQRMVRDVVEAGVLPAGALSVICGSSAELMDQLQSFAAIARLRNDLNIIEVVEHRTEPCADKLVIIRQKNAP